MTEAEIQKHLGDKIFKFELDIQNDKLTISLRELNAGKPLCYELSFTLEEIQKKNKMYNSCMNLEEVKEHLSHVFKEDSTNLKSLEDGKKIQINFKLFNIAKIVDENFILDIKSI